MNLISNKTILFIFIFTLIFVAFAKHHNSEDDDKVKIPYHEYSGPRVYAIADLHGDYNVAIRALKLARLINDDLAWIGGDSILVQTGDIVDRGPDSKFIYDIFMKIAEEAPKYGGKVIQLLGNHEIMQFQNQFYYVHPDEYSTFGGRAERDHAFSKEGKYGSYLRKLPLIAVVNQTLFCHAGVKEIFAKKGIRYMNQLAYDSLHADDFDYNYAAQRLFGDNGPVWTRSFDPEFSSTSVEVMCKKVVKTLDMLNLDRMVIGHNVQMDHVAKIHCDEKLFEMDVGMSKWYGGGLSVFYHGPNGIRVLTEGDTHDSYFDVHGEKDKDKEMETEEEEKDTVQKTEL